MSSKLAYSVPEACHQLGDLKRDKFYRLVRSGEISIIKIGRRTVVTDDALRDYLRRAQRAAA
ncbi:MAG: helix-turn-helix domain-containing protein [Gammaproteobacteria bacterium]|nr:helix-turn-helix domain-containing protein [Gammaproteobacteria bacterium]